MRFRTLLSIAAILFALPALARAKQQPLPPKAVAPVDSTPEASKKLASADALAAFSDVRLDAAFDVNTAPENKDVLLDLAREGYQKALKQEPKNQSALLGIARLYARVGEKEKAVAAYKKYLAEYPKDVKGVHETALAHARWKDWAGACAWCEFALKIDPENREVKKTQGFCLAEAGKWDDAFAMLCQIMPEAQARHNLAGLLDHRGHTDGAKVQMQLAVKADQAPAPAPLPPRVVPPAPVPTAPVRVAPTPVTPPASAWTTPAPVAATPAPATPVLQTKVFEVSDLIMPDQRLSGDAANKAHQKNSERLVKIVTEMVRPYSWSENGGAGKIEFFDIGSALVVNQTADVLKEIADLLDALQRQTKTSVLYEVRVVKAPVGFSEKAGLKLARDVALTTEQLTKLLEAAQGQRTANVMQAPRVTADEGQSVTAKVGEERFFVTGIEVMKVKGQTVHIPKNTPVHLGVAFTGQGKVSADGQYVHVQAAFTDTRLVGNVELTPIVTQITPVFEGGSQGKPVPFTQYLQVPDLRTEQAERTAIIPNGGTLVVGGWKEVSEPQGKKPGIEQEVIVLATVRASKAVELKLPVAAVPAPARFNEVIKVKNVAAADAARALQDYATKHFQGNGPEYSVVVIAEPVANTVLISATADVHKQIAKLLAALDREPEQVVVQAMVLEAPRGFAARAGLGKGHPHTGEFAKTLTPREVEAFNDAIRKEKATGTLDILSRPQIQVCDNQTGFVRVGQDFPVFGGCEVVPVCGAFAVVPSVTTQPLGVTLNLTPRIKPGGKSALLRTEVQITDLGRSTVQVGGTNAQVFNSQTVEQTAEVPFGDTLVLSGGVRTVEGRSDNGGVTEVTREERETLIVITPHRVRTTPEVRPAGGWFTK